MPLYVRDDAVRELATRLSKRRDCTVTDALRAALEEALARDDAERAARRRKAQAILARFDSARRGRFTDRDLYDDDGLPIA